MCWRHCRTIRPADRGAPALELEAGAVAKSCGVVAADLSRSCVLNDYRRGLHWARMGGVISAPW